MSFQSSAEEIELKRKKLPELKYNAGNGEYGDLLHLSDDVQVGLAKTNIKLFEKTGNTDFYPQYPESRKMFNYYTLCAKRYFDYYIDLCVGLREQQDEEVQNGLTKTLEEGSTSVLLRLKKRLQGDVDRFEAGKTVVMRDVFVWFACIAALICFETENARELSKGNIIETGLVIGETQLTSVEFKKAVLFFSEDGQFPLDVWVRYDAVGLDIYGIPVKTVVQFDFEEGCPLVFILHDASHAEDKPLLYNPESCKLLVEYLDNNEVDDALKEALLHMFFYRYHEGAYVNRESAKKYLLVLLEYGFVSFTDPTEASWDADSTRDPDTDDDFYDNDKNDITQYADVDFDNKMDEVLAKLKEINAQQSAKKKQRAKARLQIK